MLEKYVRLHHAPNQIIGDKSDGTMTQRKLIGTCLLAEFELINIKDALDNESWDEVMNECCGFIMHALFHLEMGTLYFLFLVFWVPSPGSESFWGLI